jgi:hypothetical protein
MIINYMAREITRGGYKLARISILIKKNQLSSLQLQKKQIIM